MNKSGPIVIIEDDIDDQELLGEIFKELNYPNEVVFFGDGELALKYLNNPEVSPFLVLSDINMPRLTGMELRERVFENEQISRKCIPYLFFTTAASKDAVIKAYSLSAQGFFVKPTAINGLLEMIRSIMTYWGLCYSPNRYGS